MAQFDFPLEKLKGYDPGEEAPADFAAFWERTLAETAGTGGVEATFEPVAERFYKGVEVLDVTYRGYMGQPVKGWMILPRDGGGAAGDGGGKLPCLVTYIGYGGGRGLPLEHLLPAVAGMAHFVMDTRGQGSTWTIGATADPTGSEPAHPGYMTRGIGSPETYYYRRVYVDAVRAVSAAAAHPRVDAGRIAVTGISQGGGLSVVVAGLLGERVKVCMPDVPFLCHFTRATKVVDTMPYYEIGNYLRMHRDKTEQAFKTLSYFDGIHFSPRIKARVMMSVALMDQICPPSTVFAAYNRIRGEKEMRVYDFNGHEGGGIFQAEERMKFAGAWL